MITPEEREEIITASVERALLMLPEVIGQLIQHKVGMKKMVEGFYADNKELIDYKEIVGNVMEEVESKNPGVKPSELMKEALPLIKRRIETVKSVDITRADRPTDTRMGEL